MKEYQVAILDSEDAMLNLLLKSGNIPKGILTIDEEHPIASFSDENYEWTFAIQSIGINDENGMIQLTDENGSSWTFRKCGEKND